MAVLKCPKCGKLCREGLVPFPRCGQCHEQLRKCRYCAHFDAQMHDCVCTARPEDFHIHDADLYLACPYHKTSIAWLAGEPAVRRRVWAPAFALAAVAVLAALAWLHTRPSPRAAGPTLHARAAPVEEAFLQEPLTMHIQILNSGPGPTEEVVFGLDRSCERHVTVTSVEPEPTREARTGTRTYMWFPPLQERGVLELRLHVIPIKQGTWQFAADILTAGGSRRERLEATLEIAP